MFYCCNHLCMCRWSACVSLTACLFWGAVCIYLISLVYAYGVFIYSRINRAS